MDIQLIEHKFNALPDVLKKEALDFIDFLSNNKKFKRLILQHIQYSRAWRKNHVIFNFVVASDLDHF